nr:MAG TPA: hypothetical protein [Caudoviricetes sp.]
MPTFAIENTTSADNEQEPNKQRRRTRPDKNFKLIYSTLLQTGILCVIMASATRNP